MENIIEVRNLVKKYDDFKLGSLDLNIPSGSIIGLIGENGAGKTTLIKCILNIINRDEGSIKVFGKDNKEYEGDIKEDIGIVLDNIFFPEIIQVKDIDTIMKGIYKNWNSEVFNKYLQDFELPKKAIIKNLSKGMRKKLEIITAISHSPKLLILDEPTSGLDPVVRSEVLEIFMDFIQDEEHSILLSTHITSDLEHIADKIVFIDKGNIVLDKTRDELLENYGILKCDKDYFDKIDKKDIIAYKKNKYDCEILINNKNEIVKKYSECIIDKITLEELMVLIIKGEKVC